MQKMVTSLMITSYSNICDLQNMFSGISGHTQISRDGWSEPTVLDLWAVDPRNQDGISLRATWTPEKGLETRHSYVFVNPANNFQNRTLKIGIVEAITI